MTKEFGFKLIGIQSLCKKDLPPIKYLVNDFIIKAGLTYVVGPPASFKTGLMLLTAISGACRENVLNFKINKHFKTLFIDEENGIINTKDRVVKLIHGLDVDVFKEMNDSDIIFSNISNFLFVKPHIDALEKLIKKYKPDLIIIDNIARCLKGDERHEQDVTEILGLIKPLIETYGVSFVIIHHTRKGNSKKLEDISGSRDFGGQCDNAFMLKQYRKYGIVKSFVLTQVKSKYGLEMEAINFSVASDTNDNLIVKYDGTATDNIKSIVDEIKQVLMAWVIENHKAGDIFKTKDMIGAMKDLGHKDTSIRSAINLIVDEKILRLKKYGEYELLGGENDY